MNNNEHQLAFLAGKAYSYRVAEINTLLELAKHVFKGGGRQTDMEKILKNNGYTLGEARSSSSLFKAVLADEVVEGRLPRSRAQIY